MGTQSYKKYMKRSPEKKYNLLKLFIISFFGMLLLFTFIINTFSQRFKADTTVGDYRQEENEDTAKNVDGRLAMLQDEDQGKNFMDLMKKAEDTTKEDDTKIQQEELAKTNATLNESKNVVTLEPIYKVYIGSYTSAEQAKVAKDIIQDTGTGLTPIVKCIGSNNYTLQVGTFKNRDGADTMLLSVQQNHLPGRIVQEY